MFSQAGSIKGGAAPLVLMVILILAACQGTAPPDPDYPLVLSITDGQQRVLLPFELCFNVIFIPGSVNGVDSAWFILDTGFEYSLLNRDRLDSSVLVNAPTIREKQPGGEVEVTTVYGMNIGLPGIDIKADSIRALPLGGLEPVPGRRIDGIIGHEFFERFVVSIDYAAQVITIIEPDAFRYDGTGEIAAVVVENNEPFFFAEVSLPDGTMKKAKLKLDTGSADFIGFNGSYVQAVGLVSDSQPRIPVLGTAVGGHTDNWVTRMAAFRVGEVTISNPVVGYSVDTLRGGDAGTIGGEFLRRFTATFDYYRDRLILESNSALIEPIEYDMSGIFPIADPPEFAGKRILVVTPGSPADRAGLQAGDELVSIDGVPCEEYSICELRRLFMQPGEEYKVIVNRNDSPVTCVLRLERLI